MTVLHIAARAALAFAVALTLSIAVISPAEASDDDFRDVEAVASASTAAAEVAGASVDPIDLRPTSDGFAAEDASIRQQPLVPSHTRRRTGSPPSPSVLEMAWFSKPW